MFYRKKKAVKKVVFISGLAGTGKSAQYFYFLENPLQGFQYFDYDRGKYPILRFRDDPEKNRQYRMMQNEWWLRVAEQTCETHHLIPVIFGHCLVPEAMKELLPKTGFTFNDLHFGLLACSDEERELRLNMRTYPAPFESKDSPELKWFLNKTSKYSEINIDNTHLSIQETALIIKEYLHTLI